VTRRKAIPHSRQPGKVFCPDCRKYGWHARKEAKRMEKEYPEEQMRPYRCPVDNGLWHLGHLPRVVRRGYMSADDWYDNAPEVPR
jgi:ribosomal protein L44E